MIFEHVKPLQLVADKQVTIDINDRYLDVAAVKIDTTKSGASIYTIMMNKKLAQAMFEQSWAKKFATLEQFLSGLLFHEICHIKFDAFKFKLPFDNDFARTIHNILLDSQGEYKFAAEFPSLSVYIRLILNVLKRDVYLQAVNEEKGKFEGRIRDLFYLVRFGVITKDADQDFINFCLPIILSSSRGDSENVMKATVAIYNYLYSQMSEDTKQNIGYSKASFTPINSGEMSDIEASDSVAAAKTVEDIKQELDASSSVGKSNHIVTIEDKDNAFYRQVVANNMQLIQKIRRSFKLRLDQMARVSSFDGDLQISRQQQAYVDSFTDESGLNYEIFKRKETALDVVVFRDISGSTDRYKTPYATLTVILLAALHGLKGIRIAEIDFTDTAAVLLDFDENIKQSRLFPRSEGGTQLVPAYMLAENFRWKARKRIGIVITDGGISGDYAAYEKKMKKEKGIRIEKWDVENNSNRGNVRQTTFETFHIDIARWLLDLV